MARITENRIWRPSLIFLKTLGIVAISETVVMLILPSILPTTVSIWSEAACDALLLSLISTPFLLLLVARPLVALAKSERVQTNATLRSAVDPIVTISIHGLIQSYNPAAGKLFGYSESEMMGKNVKALMPSPYREAHDGYLKAYMNTGIRKVIGIGREVTGQKKDGTTFPLHLSVSKVSIKGRAIVFTGIIRDLSEAKQQKAKLIKAKYDAEVSNRSKSEFLANMSHEIRTPMTSILGFTDLLLDNVSTTENIAWASTIKRNGEYLLNLINNILDLSKIDAGKIELEQISTSPHQLIADVVSLMRVPSTAKKLTLDVKFDGSIPEKIQTDPTRLRQVLINLIGNAIKFTEAGGIQVVSRLLNETGEDPKLQIDVIDTGIGIPSSKIDQIFKPFTQADGSTTRDFGGTGLGLSISKHFIELLGGEFNVSSTFGDGSTFSITIPTGSLDNIKVIQNVVEAGVETKNEKVTGITDLPLNNKRILLTEDGQDNQRLISFVLKKAGAEVTLADNGQIGLDLATTAKTEGRPFDVVLMDMQMPVLDGYSATSQLRSDGYTGPIIALTAHAMSSDRQKCTDAGCDDYTTKPINRKKLIELVATYANRTEETVPT